MTAPKPLRVPARLMMSALIGRIRIPDPIMARQSSPTAPTAASCTDGTRATRPASA